MHALLFILCTAVFVATVRHASQIKSLRLEIIYIAYTSLYFAYPVKNIFLYFYKSDFITFDFTGSASVWPFIHFIIFSGILYLVLSKYVGDDEYVETESTTTRPERIFFIIVLFLNSLAIFYFSVWLNNVSFSDAALSSDARRSFLMQMQGQGWISLLIFSSYPLLALQKDTSKTNPIVMISFFMTILSLLVIGSRLFLFGYIFATALIYYKVNIKQGVLWGIGFALGGAAIYRNFIGDSAETSLYYSAVYFMRTFDGADIMNGYMESSRQLYYGLTLVQDTFLTYFPRALWEGKPFNFGGIIITGDIYPELQDVAGLGATFPPGLFTEAAANFGLLFPAMYYVICRILVWLSAKKRHANPYSFALFISVATTSGTFFRGFGSLIVQVTAYVLALVIVRALASGYCLAAYRPGGVG